MINNAQILLIENDPKDSIFINNVIYQYNPNLTLKVVLNYIDAADYLFLSSLEETESNLQLIILEITLSDRKGVKLLQSIKQHPLLKKIPLIVLTNSTIPEDVQFCYEEHVNAFIYKPKSKERFELLLKILLKFWIDTISLPEHAWD